MLNNLRKSLSNIPGWSTKRHIVVFESDDWGSIRTRSKQDYEAMLAAGLNVDESIFPKFDCLESNTDLERLFELLSKHKDSTGRPPVFTPMCIMANPNFEKIRENGFAEYVYESMPETHKHYYNHDRVVDLWHEGIEKRLFVPALHGREHLNCSLWLDLTRTNEGMKIAFDHQSMGMCKFKGIRIEAPHEDYCGAFQMSRTTSLAELQQIVLDAGRLFESMCGYIPTHFIAPDAEPAYGLDPSFAQIGVRYITNAKLRHPDLGNGRTQNEFVWLGKYYKELDIINITRNGAFEQVDPGHDWVNECMADIDNAFKWHKPCVISSHRVNYIGGIDESNASLGLKLLDQLLTEIEKKWPDVEYMTSTELGDIIRKEKGL